MRADEFHQGRRNGLKWAVEWLHRRANEMDDPHAKAILNGAAFNMGNDAKLEKAPSPDYATALREAIQAERERTEAIIEDWTRADRIRLAAGEITAAEMNAVQAVMRGALAAIRSRK